MSRKFWTERGVIPRWQYLLVYLAIVAAGVMGFHRTQQQGDQTQQLAARTEHLSVTTNVALCAFRRDLVTRSRETAERITQTVRFIETHPDGFAGLPKATLEQSVKDQRRSLDAQRRTVHALRGLDCK